MLKYLRFKQYVTYSLYIYLFQVTRHLAKLFDNIADLKFQEHAENEAAGMYSKEKEYVPFSVACQCTGQVIITM